jgi:hypothetical protein
MAALGDLFVDVSATCPATNGTGAGEHLIPENGFGIVQLLLFVAFYGYILSKASQLIADGSELLLLVLDPGIVGGLVLPVMGAGACDSQLCARARDGGGADRAAGWGQMARRARRARV